MRYDINNPDRYYSLRSGKRRVPSRLGWPCTLELPRSETGTTLALL